MKSFAIVGNTKKPQHTLLRVFPNGELIRRAFADKNKFNAIPDYTGMLKTKAGYFLHGFFNANNVFDTIIRMEIEEYAARCDLMEEFRSKRFQDFRRDHIEKSAKDITKNSADMTVEILGYERTGRKYTHVLWIPRKTVMEVETYDHKALTNRFADQIQYAELCERFENSQPARSFLQALVSGYLSLEAQPEIIEAKYGSADKIRSLIEDMTYEQAVSAMNAILQATPLSRSDPQWQFNCIVEELLGDDSAKHKKKEAVKESAPECPLDLPNVNFGFTKMLLGDSPLCDQAVEDMQNALRYLKTTTLNYLHVASDDRPTEILRDVIFENISTDTLFSVLRRYIARYETILKKDSPRSRQLYLLSCLYNEIDSVRDRILDDPIEDD